MGKKRGNGQGSIGYRSDRKVFEVRVVQQGRRRLVGTTRSKSEANAMLREALNRMAAEEVAVDSAMLFRDFAEYWRDEILPTMVSARRKQLALASQNTYRSALDKRIVPVIGDLQLRSITSNDIERVMRAIAKDGLSSSYQRTTHKVMVLVMKSAKKHQLVARLPFDDVVVPGQETKPRIVPDASQLEEMVRVAKGDIRLQTFILMLAHLGARINEALSATWGDVDVKQRTILLHGKGSKDRVVPISGTLWKQLQKWRLAQKRERMEATYWVDGPDYILTASYGQHWDQSAARKQFRPVVEQALPGCVPHSLRHCFGTESYRAGVPLKTISEAMGHSDISVTSRIYVKADLDLLRNGIDTLDRRLSGVGGGEPSQSDDDANSA